MAALRCHQAKRLITSAVRVALVASGLRAAADDDDDAAVDATIAVDDVDGVVYLNLSASFVVSLVSSAWAAGVSSQPHGHTASRSWNVMASSVLS